MVNHVSALSSWFLDWKERGSDSPWEGLFLPVDRLYPDGVSEEDRQRIYTRKPREPWIPVSFADGSVRDTWCTFTEEQIDINVFSEVGRKWLEDELGELCRHRGIKTVRLDAAGYATKKPGTRFFFEEPEIVELFERCKSIARQHNVELLPEVHEHFTYQEKLAGWDMPVYDFALPMLLLYALYSGNGRPVADWLRKCPRRSITTLDTHDGIGVVDVADLLTPEQIDFTVNALYEKGSNVNRRYSSSAYGNLDLYQINCTYFSAVGENDDAYLAARAVQFFAPGIPQVYYVGLFAGANDVELVERTLQGRDINRHGYSIEEAEAELQRPVVQRLLKLMRFRNECPVFENNNLEIELEDNGRILHIVRSAGRHRARLTVNFSRATAEITSTGPEGLEKIRI
jgi:sucrose phosphorylase